MSAFPLIPGHAYRVHYQGLTFNLLASHPCDAICAVLSQDGAAGYVLSLLS